MIHIDLFAGLGGNSLAFDAIFNETKNTHIFCEIEPYCQAVLKKHWPDSRIHADINTFIADPDILGCLHGKPQKLSAKGPYQAQRQLVASSHSPFMVTGGFPCQPFSQAGQRRGTEDDRHLWPEMLRIIRATKPHWVIAENVRGILTIGGGMVFEQVCADLEGAGYEVQPFVIPAVAVDAPHRRDRVWFVAHRASADTKRIRGHQRPRPGEPFSNAETHSGIGLNDRNLAQNSSGERRRRRRDGDSARHDRQIQAPRPDTGRDRWQEGWLEVATRLCRVDDGLPAGLDGFKLSASGHRKARLKALGNSIVPQVAMEIMRAIRATI